MKNLINNKKKILILILIFIIILFILLKIVEVKDLYSQEDLIFFKLFGIGNSQIQENNKETTSSKIINSKKENESDKNNIYKVNVKKAENTYEKINLLQSIDLKTLVNEKIAPGTKGSFYVYLTSNTNMDYEMKIVDKNKSPKNFKFEINEKQGRIEKNKLKKIEVKWEWPYEIDDEENIQDTKDGENIEEYDFEICTIGR